MALRDGFFESLNGDRKYYMRDIASFFDGIITEGVFMHIGEKFFTVPNTGMTVSVGTGKAWIDKSYLENDADYIVSIDTADILLPRIDAIVLDFDNDDAVRRNTITYLKGEPSSDPQPPTLIDTETRTQKVAAYISVAANATEITTGDISVEVGKAPLPFVEGVISTIDIGIYINAWEDQFSAWQQEQIQEFEAWVVTIRDILDAEVAGHLMNLIDSLSARVTSIEQSLNGYSIQVVTEYPETPVPNVLYFKTES